MHFKIAFTGPESTGKTTLASTLAKIYGTVWVEEYARDYVNQLERPYTQADILHIAQQQLQLENLRALQANDFLFCDTELIVCKVWSMFKYQSCDDWILEKIQTHNYDFYFLCDIDIPWEYDPLREHPTQRQALLQHYENELIHYKKPYKKLSGSLENRLAQVQEVLQALVNSKL